MPESPSHARVSSSEIVGKMAGEYRLRGLLGEGGFGAVYEAEHPLLKRRAAVKVLHRVGESSSDAVQRFISEAQAVNQIRSRHIIDIFSFGTLSDGRHFYVMDYLEGEPLDRFLKRTRQVDVATTLQLLQPIADALDLAHGAGIIHRDLKPQNIFLAWDKDDEVVPKLLDFGMAKLLGSSPVRTVSGTPIGTPLYMAPEQARGDKVDARCDVYALGVLCYEMLVGQLPFDAETTVAVLMAHLIQEPERPSHAANEVSAELDAPLLHMLEKDPSKRPESAGVALKALRDAASRAGIEIPSGLPHLPRPEPTISGEFGREVESTLLADAPTPERATELSQRPEPAGARRWWPLAAAGLVLIGAALAWFGSQAASPSSASSAPSVVAPPLVSESPVRVTVDSAAVAAPSAPTPSPSASDAPDAQPAKRAKPALETKPKRPAEAKASASATPHDLESPFGP
ncbi:MAG: serine/threonine-protein kinase [Polyangiaceae bacterium]